MNEHPVPIQSPDGGFASVTAVADGIQMRYVMTPRFPERSYSNRRILSGWHLREGCLFQRGDPLYTVVIYHDWFPALTRMASTIRASEPGILLAIDQWYLDSHTLPVQPVVCASYVAPADWTAFVRLLQSHEAVVRHWEATGDYLEAQEDQADWEALEQEIAESRNRSRVLAQEMAGLRSEVERARGRAAELRRSAANLAPAPSVSGPSPTPRRQAILRDASLAEIVALLLRHSGDFFPVHSGAAAANARLLETVTRRIAALFSPGIPLDPGVLSRIWPDWEMLEAFAAEFARFDRAVLAIAADTALGDSEKRARWRALRQNLTKYVNAALPDRAPDDTTLPDRAPADATLPDTGHSGGVAAGALSSDGSAARNPSPPVPPLPAGVPSA